MGGNALKSYPTKRLNKGEYRDFNVEFQLMFRNAFGFLPILIKSYEEKNAFGDADYLLDNSLLDSFWTSRLKSVYSLKDEQYVRNTNVVSLGYKNFQVDLISTPHDEMQIAEKYFAYNDFSNLIGRMLHKLGIKLGHNGLWLIVREDDKGHVLAEILLSRNYYDALEILGLDRSIYDEGIKNLNQMFEYIATSKYFDREIFSLDHRSATSRVRDKKRKTYHEFLQWIERVKPISNYEFASKSEKGGYNIRHPYFTTEVLKRWPWVGWEVDRTIEDSKKRKAFKEIYNGSIVAEITGLNNKDLGAFMLWTKPKMDYFLNSYLSAEDILRPDNKEQMRNAIKMQYRLYQGISQ